MPGRITTVELWFSIGSASLALILTCDRYLFRFTWRKGLIFNSGGGRESIKTTGEKTRDERRHYRQCRRHRDDLDVLRTAGTTRTAESARDLHARKCRSHRYWNCGLLLDVTLDGLHTGIGLS